MKKNYFYPFIRKSISKVALAYLLFLSSFLTLAQGPTVIVPFAPITLPVGSFIIDMGITPQTVANGLKPYGLLYQLLKIKTPVIWSIKQDKVKDGIDFTIGARNFRGGPFVILKQYRTAAVDALISTWTAPGIGVVGFTTTAPVTIPVFVSSLNQPKWTLDAQNGGIATSFFANAGIPCEAYGCTTNLWKKPGDLGCCDDIFVMPHADPKWWVTIPSVAIPLGVRGHGNLLNWNLQCQGAIWLGCHAGSALENMYNPLNTSEQTNFLTTKATTPGTGIILPVNGSTNYAQNSLVLWGAHADGTPPYNTNTGAVPNGTLATPGDPVSQFMGTPDLAQQNGSEQMYMPVLGQGFRISTKIITYDPLQSNTPPLNNLTPISPGPAVSIAYGPGLGEAARANVMLEASHNISGTAPANIAAQRAFFNFSMLATYTKAVVPTMSAVPANMNSGQGYNLSITVPPPANINLYKVTWSSTCGNGPTTVFAGTTLGLANITYTPPVAASPTTCNISVVIEDDCGRVTFDAKSTLVQCNLAVATTITNPCSNATTSGAIAMAITNGSGPFNYSWTKTGGVAPFSGTGTLNTPTTLPNIYTIPNLSAGTYTVTVTANSGAGCPVTFTVSLATSPAVAPLATAVPVLCFGGSTGAINTTVSGGTPGFTYNWGGEVLTQNRSGLPIGTYTVTVTDSKGCIGTTSATVNQPLAPLSASAPPTAINCFGQSTGSINLTVSGGTQLTGGPPFYNYLWSNGAITEDISGLAAGTYSVTVTDKNACTTSVSNISVTQPLAGPLSLSFTQINPSCNGSTNGSIDLSVTGGTPGPGYTYAWTGPGFTASSEDIGSRPAGTYSVVVTDSKNCTANLSVTLTQPALLTLSTSNIRPTCPPSVASLGNNGAINLTVSGGTVAYGYAWTASNGGTVPSGQANQQNLTLLVAGTYSVLVTDSKLCTATTSVILTNINPIPLPLTQINH